MDLGYVISGNRCTIIIIIILCIRIYQKKKRCLLLCLLCDNMYTTMTVLRYNKYAPCLYIHKRWWEKIKSQDEEVMIWLQDGLGGSLRVYKCFIDNKHKKRGSTRKTYEIRENCRQYYNIYREKIKRKTKINNKIRLCLTNMEQMSLGAYFHIDVFYIVVVYYIHVCPKI